MLPSQSITLGNVSFPRDRLWLTLIIVIFGISLWAFFKFTRIGLATRASAENERAVSLARYSPQLLAASTWIISSVAVGTVVILSSPTTVLNPFTYTFAVVPALAAALIGRLQSIAITVAAALGLGAFQSVVQYQTSKPWWPKWAVSGLSDAVPFIVIVVALFIVGKSLPSRGAVRADPLPDVIRPKNRPAVVAMLFLAALAAMALLHGSDRFGLITSFIVTMIMLSFVVLTGFVGQISLAQAAIAGTAGFALVEVRYQRRHPLPVLASSRDTCRRRQWHHHRNPSVENPWRVACRRDTCRRGGSGTVRVQELELLLDLRKPHTRHQIVWRELRRTTRPQRRPIPIGVLVLVTVSVLCVLVANVAKSATGRRFLAVRSNERAAASTGINVSSTKLLAFAIASFLAGMGGSFIGFSRGQLSADSFATLVGIAFSCSCTSVALRACPGP